MTQVLEQTNSVYVNGCLCHTGNKVESSFALETGCGIEDMLVDIFHWFNESSKRKNTLEEFCEFVGQDSKKKNMRLLVGYLWKQLLLFL